MRACLAICLTLFIVALSPQVFSDDSCRPLKITTNHKVTHIYDGDTVKINDGRKIRLIGINTPELYPVEEPMALEAKNELLQLLKSYAFNIHLQLGTKKQDRYGRYLAHIFLEDGTNVSAWLLRHGHGYWITVGKNDKYIGCYQKSELSARYKRRGVWQNLSMVFKPANQLNTKSKGFYLIQGQLVRVFETDIAIWLELKSGLRLRLDKRNYGNFSSKNYVKSIGETIMTRGWVYTSRGKVMMNISHPSLIETVINK